MNGEYQVYHPLPMPGFAARQIAAVVVGNALEFYDFLTYAFFAVQIGHAFFPTQNPSSSLLLSLATFGAGFLMRPIGGLVIGRMGVASAASRRCCCRSRVWASQ